MSESKNLIAEAMGTFIMVFAGTGAIAIDALFGGIGLVGIAITFGFVIVALIYSFGHISGAHFNPAVTIAFWSIGEFSGKQVLPYILSQAFGAIIASYLLLFLLSENFTTVGEAANLGATMPSGSIMQAFIFEFLLSFILMLVICSSAVHGMAIKDFAGIAIGFTVGLEAMFAGPITGASMNPARSIGPSLASGQIDHLWIYIIATIFGMIVAAQVFLRFIKCKDPSECKL